MIIWLLITSKRAKSPPHHWDVLHVLAQNPIAANDILAPFEYDIWCYENKTPNVWPPTLGRLFGRVRTRNGAGASFDTPEDQTLTIIIFATKVTIIEPPDPWEVVTSVSMGGVSYPGCAYTCGYLKFNLAGG